MLPRKEAASGTIRASRCGGIYIRLQLAHGGTEAFFCTWEKQCYSQCQWVRGVLHPQKSVKCNLAHIQALLAKLRSADQSRQPCRREREAQRHLVAWVSIQFPRWVLWSTLSSRLQHLPGCWGYTLRVKTQPSPYGSQLWPWCKSVKAKLFCGRCTTRVALLPP